MAYYMLCTKDENGKLHQQFGDRERSVVVQEKSDSYSGMSTVMVRATSAQQTDVDKAVASMEAFLAEQRQKLGKAIGRTIARRRAV
jgi:hypothetical protein